MSIDPSKLPVQFAGFVYDWIITREWTKVGLAGIPIALLATAAAGAYWGQRLDKNGLAQWYMEIAEEESAGWDQSIVKSDEDETGATPLSRYGEALFRRVEQLSPRDRSRFVIAVIKAQQGALPQAKQLLREIAPDNKKGYAPAHAVLAEIMMMEGINVSNMEIAKHHFEEAKEWDRTPVRVLAGGAELFRQLGDSARSMQMMQRAAESAPEHNLMLSKFALLGGNERLAEQSRAKAIAHFSKQLEKTPDDSASRISLADALSDAKEFSKAEEVLREGIKPVDPDEKLIRARSEVFRRAFLDSLKRTGEDRWSGNVLYLDYALQADPTNPLVFETIASLTRAPGVNANANLIEKLLEFLARGQATPVTHMWLAEAYLVRKDYEQALKHLEVAVNRMPNAAHCLNNLAFVLAEIRPERMEEALQFARQSAILGKTNADFFDTLGMVASRLNRDTEAITAYEKAIELAPTRIDFRQAMAAQYRKVGDEAMAARVETQIEVIKKAQEEARIRAEELAAQQRAAAEKEAAEREAAAQAAVLAARNAERAPSPDSDLFKRRREAALAAAQKAADDLPLFSSQVNATTEDDLFSNQNSQKQETSIPNEEVSDNK
ncbi:MAG: tetratricopeptide repeat protein [Planctomycetales bacterium]|nr:tetratricopeptide repeat protein [Planctomycetales bacterium]